jgi:hypothetical protein
VLPSGVRVMQRFEGVDPLEAGAMSGGVSGGEVAGFFGGVLRGPYEEDRYGCTSADGEQRSW